MPTLHVRHISTNGLPQFQVVRSSDGKSAGLYTAPDPFRYPVHDQPKSNLMTELQWYLEQFLEYPFPPETTRADHVLAALKLWGEEAFNCLFSNRDSGHFFDEAISQGHSCLLLRIISDDPMVQTWPWEALRDPKADWLAHACRVERCMDKVGDPVRLDSRLSKDRVNILLVTARPYKQDVTYQSVSGPLVEMIEEDQLPAHVHILRPPTFEHFVAHLRERPGFYHIVHFDGHGSLTGDTYGQNQHSFRAEGKLVFEDARGEPDVKAVDQLGPVLREHNIPCVVLNACQSGMHAPGSGDPFASVASALLKAGVRSVVAMAYSLYVSGARQFLPAFYRRLFASGSVAEAVRDGRLKMLAKKGRLCVRGEYPLEDWLVPVLYQQEAMDFSFAAKAKADFHEYDSCLPPEVSDLGAYGLVGRETAILSLERMLRGKTPSILVHGMGGVGKTTLVKGFLQWLARTEGLGKRALWLSFRDTRSAEFVLNALGGSLLGDPFLRQGMEEKVESLVKIFSQHPFLVVWDNFETAAGIPGTTIAPLLSEKDLGVLRDLLRRLRGGKTKILITSRSAEEWLGQEQCRVIELSGLQGGERWEYCQRIIDDLGIKVDREDKSFAELINQLGGHPLAMRAILPLLEHNSSAEVLKNLRDNFEALGPFGEEAHQTIYGTFRYAMEALPERLRPLLYPLSLYEGYAEANVFEVMGNEAGLDLNQQEINNFFNIISKLGVIRQVGGYFYELHPALTGFLRTNAEAMLSEEQRQSWRAAFIEWMTVLAEKFTAKPLSEQQTLFSFYQANFYMAHKLAKQQGNIYAVDVIAQYLVVYAIKTLAFGEAKQRLQEIIADSREHGREVTEANALQQMGIVMQETGKLGEAREWYLQSLAINERRGYEEGRAIIYHQLGIVAMKTEDFVGAREWFLKALAINEGLNDEQGIANEYHHLGIMAQKTKDLAEAREWLLKALDINERLADEERTADSYHQLGISAQLAENLDEAREWFRKSLAIRERLGDEGRASSTYHHLGSVAQQTGDMTSAREWLLKSLVICERRGDESGMARTYHQLGSLAQAVGDLPSAREWYLKSVAIHERREEEAELAKTYHQLSIVEEKAGDIASARELCRKSLALSERNGDGYGVWISCMQMGLLEKSAGDAEASRLWFEKGFGPVRKSLGFFDKMKIFLASLIPWRKIN